MVFWNIEFCDEIYNIFNLPFISNKYLFYSGIRAVGVERDDIDANEDSDGTAHSQGDTPV